MVAQPDRLHLSIEEFLALDRSNPEVRYEYIDGMAYMLARGKLSHSRIKLNFAVLLSNLLRDSSCNVFDSDAYVRLAEKRYVLPDVTVTCDQRDEDTDDAIQYPRLIIEVLLPSTEVYDRDRKFTYYRACPTVEEYVLVNTEHQSIEVRRRRGQSRFWELAFFGTGEQVELRSLNISIPVEAIYRNARVPEDA